MNRAIIGPLGGWPTQHFYERAEGVCSVALPADRQNHEDWRIDGCGVGNWSAGQKTLQARTPTRSVLREGGNRTLIDRRRRPTSARWTIDQVNRRVGTCPSADLRRLCGSQEGLLVVTQVARLAYRQIKPRIGGVVLAGKHALLSGVRSEDIRLTARAAWRPGFPPGPLHGTRTDRLHKDARNLRTRPC